MTPSEAQMSDEANTSASALASHQQRIGQGRLRNAAALLSLSSMGLRMLSLVTTAILARILTPSDYGVVAIGVTAVGFLDVLTNIQASSSLIRASEITDEQLRSAFTINFMRGVLSAVLLFALAYPLARVFGEPRVEPLLRVLSIVPLLNGLQNPVFIMFERQMQFFPDVIRTLCANLAGTLTGVAYALAFHSFWALVASTVAIVSVHLLMTYWRVPVRIGFSLRDFSEMFSFGGWLALMSIVDYANAKVDIVLIGRGLGSSLLGGYQAGQQIMTMATGDVVGPMVRAIFPSLARTVDFEELRRKYLRIQGVIISLALPVGIGLSALAPLVVRVLLGGRWDTAIPVVQILAPLIALQTTLATVDSVAMVRGETRLLFRRTVTVFVVRVSLMLMGFYLGGFMGIIYARVFSGLFYLFYGWRLAAGLTNTSIWTPVANSWRSLLAAMVMYLVLMTLPAHALAGERSAALIVELVMRIGLGAAVYGVVHVALWHLLRRPDGVERVLLAELQSLLAGLRPKPV